MSGVERYVDQYRATRASAGPAVVARPRRGRMLVLTAAFTPMVAVAALPATALISLIASLVANVTASWVGLVLLIAAVLGLGYLTARWAAGYDDTPATRGWRRWLPLAATVVVVGACLAEIVSGSRAPDPVFVLWFASIVWVAAFLPLATGVWGPGRRALWAVGPAVTVVAILFVWTQGFFSLRFGRAVDDFDALAQRVANGAQIANGTHVGGFVVHHVNRSRLARNAGCDIELWITGWHQQDTRYIAHCLRHPTGDFTHLAGDWWQLEVETRPSDL